jgi:hypothetical protein
MRMEAAVSMRIPRVRNASFDHARRYAVIAGQLFRGRESFGPAELAARPCFQFLHLGPNSAYASFGYQQSGRPRPGLQHRLVAAQDRSNAVLLLPVPPTLLARADEVIE